MRAGSPCPAPSTPSHRAGMPARCWPRRDLSALLGGPAVQVGEVPTIFGPRHPLLTAEDVAAPPATPTVVAVEEDPACYVVYGLSGGV
jgi:hypothetical protein